MNNRKVNIVLGLLVTVLAIVSVFILFATAFGKSDYSDHPSTLGSCFNVMFGNQGFEPVPGLIVAFVLQCVAILFALFGTILPGKIPHPQSKDPPLIKITTAEKLRADPADLSAKSTGIV